MLESGTEWSGLRRHGGREAAATIGPESGNLVAWGGEQGCGRPSVGDIRGAGGDRRNSDFAVFPEFQFDRFSESDRWQYGSGTASIGVLSATTR